MDITLFLNLIILLFFAMITKYLIPLLRVHLQGNNFKQILEIARIVVSAANELDITGELKKIGKTKAEYALAEAKRILREKNITFNEAVLASCIKSAVTELRVNI